MMICGLGIAMIEADVSLQLCVHSTLQFTHVKEEIQCYYQWIVTIFTINNGLQPDWRNSTITVITPMVRVALGWDSKTRTHVLVS